MSKHEGKWDDLHTRIKATIAEWRNENPQATLREIETEVDEQLSDMRAQMIEDVAQLSELADFKGRWGDSRVKCPECGGEVVANGRQKKKLITDHGKVIELDRNKGYCGHCRVSFFPPG